MTIRCSETWSQLFLMSAFSCLLAGVVFYLTTDCEEIDSVVDPVAENQVLHILCARVLVILNCSTYACWCVCVRALARGSRTEQ